MNERIRELAEQANPSFKQFYITGPWHSVDIEKFAELLILECANQCDLLLDHKISSEWSRGTHDCSKAIKKYFGVEE